MEHIRNQSFPLNSKQEWIKKAEESLKGKTIDKLHSTTYENIILKPLYTKEDEQPVPDFPGGADFRRGIFPLGYLTNEWKIAQKISYNTLEDLQDKLLLAIKNGQTAISFEVTKESAAHFSELTADLYPNNPFAINSKWLQQDLIDNLMDRVNNGGNITGYIANDPISLCAKDGIIAEEFLQDSVQRVVEAEKRFPKLRMVLIDTSIYHNAGANAVQELGIAAANGVFYLQNLIDHGLKLENALEKMIFQFSMGSSFFMEAAKLRAARIIWNRITELYDADAASRGMQITASASTFTKTLFDPHVNLLRSANEAFAAVLGGVQYLHVEPFNTLTGANAFSERIARNVQLILKEETHLNKVIDPSGGSWYLETLTRELAEKAWEFFRQIEARGGICEVLCSGWLQQEIDAVYEKRISDVQYRKQSIVGTNVYAKLDESVPVPKSQPELQNLTKNSSAREIPAVLQRRLSQSFEELRIKAKQIEAAGCTPAVGLLCLGELKQHKARTDFIKGFIAAGGLQALESDPIFNPEQASEFAKSLTTNFICICGTDEKYESTGHVILTSLKAEFPQYTFFLAGLPEKDRRANWMAEGIGQFIHINCNCYETLASILAEMEVTANDKQKA